MGSHRFLRTESPIVVGVAFGLVAIAYPAARPNLEHATDRFRLFREQPTPELAHSASESMPTALSANERLQIMYHPLSSYVVVPLFALANAGIAVNGPFLAQAYASPVTLGILLGYVLDKPIGILSSTWAVTRLSRDRVGPPVGWASVVGGGTIAGIGFTVSLLIATLAFGGVELQEAKLGVLSAAPVHGHSGWPGCAQLTHRFGCQAGGPAFHRPPPRRTVGCLLMGRAYTKLSPARAKREAAKRKRQEQRWARKSGPVTVRNVCPVCGGPHLRDEHSV